MARPTKQGVDFFPVDSNFDAKTELFISENGAVGLGVLLSLWQLIYYNNGYYAEYGDDLLLLLRRRIMEDTGTIDIIIKSALNRGIFDREKFDKFNIITSRAIQKRFFVAARKKKIVSVVDNYLCSGVSGGNNSTHEVISGGRNATKEKEKEKEERPQEINSSVLSFSEDFYLYLSENGGKKKYTIKEIRQGAETVDKLIRLDGYDLETEIKGALRWGLKDGFWSGQIRSLSPLRKKTSKDGETKFSNLFGQFSAREIKETGNHATQKTCSDCSRFCKPGSPERCNKSGGRVACGEFS